MKKFFKAVLAGALSVTMSVCCATVWGAVDDAHLVDIGVEITADVDIDLVDYVATVDGDTNVADGLDFTLTGLDGNDPTTYWILSEQSMEVTYHSNYFWGLRIVSDNEGYIRDYINDPTANIEDYVNPSLIPDPDNPQTLVDTYGGLLSQEDIDDVVGGELAEDQDPSKRVTLAWMATDAGWNVDYDTSLPSATLNFNHPNGGEFVDDVNVGNCWDQPNPDSWGYIVDKNDQLFNDDIYDINDNLAYPIVSIGAPLTYGDLVPFTIESEQVDGDGDNATDMVELTSDTICIYIAGRYANTNWGDDPNVDAPFVYAMTPDNYVGRILLEVIHE